MELWSNRDALACIESETDDARPILAKLRNNKMGPSITRFSAGKKVPQHDNPDARDDKLEHAKL